MPIINQTESLLDISGNFGIIIGMIAAGVVLILIVWVFTQFRPS